MKLFVFHHAGGSAYAYNSFARSFPGEIEVVVMEMPGRGRKMNQPLIKDARLLARQFYQSVKSQLDQPYAFLGHSLGGLTGYLVIREIEAHQLPLPRAFFISAASAPSEIFNDQRHCLPSSEFWEILHEIGGIPDEVIHDSNFRQSFEPIIRADFEVLETYQYQKQPALDIPMVAIMARNDKLQPETIETWQEESTHPLKTHLLPGDHFYLFNDEQALVTIIKEQLNQSPALHPQAGN